MAVYKVPQDVEAEDKLIGPFGFRQFIYLLIVGFAGFVAYILSRVFIGLILIPLPIIIFFGALALPLRKDQPTEVYLAALLQYNLKSKRRMWKPEGLSSVVEILAPKVVEDHRTKDISEDQALTQFEKLAQIMDTRGWAGRGVPNSEVATTNMKLSDALVKEADETTDMLDADSSGAQSFDALIDEQKKMSRQETEQMMRQAATDVADSAIAYAGSKPQSAPSPEPVSPPPPTEPVDTREDAAGVAPESEDDKALLEKTKPSPYPATMRQQVIEPLADQPPTDGEAAPSVDEAATTSSPSTPDIAPQSTSSEPPLAAIIDPADDDQLTVATIAAEEARRREKDSSEVVINLH